MQLSPRYGPHPVIRIEPFEHDPIELMVQQRRRLQATLASLDDAQWRAPSRCAGWSVQDVVIHLATVNSFWAFSITSGLAGRPSTFLSTFDPVSGPAEMVTAAGGPAPSDTLSALAASDAALAEAAHQAGDRLWTAVAEAPPGHVSVGALALHALWDAHVHERDIVLPLGIAPVEDAGEIDAALRYAAALSPTFLATLGSTRSATIEVRAEDPHVGFVVDVAETVVVRAAADGPVSSPVVLRGRAIELLEALSRRAPIEPFVDPGDLWLFDGLARVFDQSNAV